MSKFTVEIDYELSDKITFESLKDCRENMIASLGNRDWVFAWDDQEEDDRELQKHIDALDLLLNWYGTPDQLKDLYGE